MATQTDVDQYLTANPGVPQVHVNWHMGGRATPQGDPGSGLEFLQFHRGLIEQFRNWLSNNGRAPLTPWIPTLSQIPNHPGWRSTFTSSKNTLSGSRSQLQARFASADALGIFIEPGIHGLVHTAFAPPPVGNGIDPVFANLMTAPRSIRFWRWHYWIDRVWTRSGL